MKRGLIYFFIVITAIAAGHYLGNVAARSLEPMINWLGNSLSFGFDTINVDLNILKLTFGIRFSINFLQIIFVLMVILIGPVLERASKK